MRERWADISLYTAAPMRPRLSGLAVEYVILADLQPRCRSALRRRSAFNVGQGTQDIGFRNDVDILFTLRPGASGARSALSMRHGEPTTAAFLDQGRAWTASIRRPSKRLAPDFFFQPQVYRADGQTIELPSGSLHRSTYSRGPEYRAADPPRRACRSATNGCSASCAGSIRRATAGSPAITTFTPPAARTTRIRPKACSPRTCGRRSSARRSNIASVLTWGPSATTSRSSSSPAQDHPLSKPDQR